MTCDMTGLSDLRQDFEARAKVHNSLPGIIKFFTNSDAEAEDYTRYAGMLKQAEEKQAGRQDGVLSTLLLPCERPVRRRFRRHLRGPCGAGAVGRVRPVY